jgi:outer membrane protein OmpA-like peptidoglycan-associated protein
MRHLFVLAAALLLGAAAPAAAQTPARVVFFTPERASIDAAGLEVVRAAAEAARAQPGARVLVIGHSAPGDDAEAERRVAEERARTVAEALALAGVPRERIATESQPATPFESAPVESRRVEIRVSHPG